MSLNEILSQKILYRKGLSSQNLLNVVVIENGTQSLYLNSITHTNRKVSEGPVCLRLFKVFFGDSTFVDRIWPQCQNVFLRKNMVIYWNIMQYDSS